MLLTMTLKVSSKDVNNLLWVAATTESVYASSIREAQQEGWYEVDINVENTAEDSVWDVMNWFACAISPKDFSGKMYVMKVVNEDRDLCGFEYVQHLVTSMYEITGGVVKRDISFVS